MRTQKKQSTLRYFSRGVVAIVVCCELLITACDAQNSKAKAAGTENQKITKPVNAMDSSIWCVYQDSKMNYWFGSNGSGVYRYTGKKLTQFTMKDGLQSNQIRGIKEDKYGNIYFENRRTVTKFDGQKFTQLTTVEAGRDQWKLQPEDMWFRGNGEIDGVYRFDGNTMYHLSFAAFNPAWNTPAHAVYSIYHDHSGNIWFGTLSAGVCRFDGKTLQWIHEKELSTLDDGRVPAVRYILEDGDGNYWLSNILSRYKILPDNNSTDALVAYTREQGIDQSNQKERMVLPYCNSALVDNGNIWMTSYNEGVWKYDGRLMEKVEVEDGTAGVLVVSAYKDRAGAIWVATDNRGIYKFNGTQLERFQPFQHIFPGD